LPTFDPEVLVDAACLRTVRRIVASGELKLPAIPAMRTRYLAALQALFTAVGRTFDDEELATLDGLVGPRLERGWALSAHCLVRVEWRTRGDTHGGVDYEVELLQTTMAERYEGWADDKAAPLFGEHPDAKVLEVAGLHDGAFTAPVLDLGAGNGRNTLPLARLGHPVDAVEITPSFAARIEEVGAAESLGVRAIVGDALREEVELPEDRYAVIVLSEVASHFRGIPDLRRFFERAARWCRPGGHIVMNCFVADDGYEPDDLVRQLSEASWCTLFTRADLEAATAGLPFAWVSNDDAASFERERQPSWPPAGWYEGWAAGRDLFRMDPEEIPVALRWLVFERR
jgi:SAM-dependent methyltransferase